MRLTVLIVVNSWDKGLKKFSEFNDLGIPIVTDKVRFLKISELLVQEIKKPNEIL